MRDRISENGKEKTEDFSKVTMKSVELFAGAGGLALGLSAAGFHHGAVIEYDEDSCRTIRVNQQAGLLGVAKWPLHHSDVRDFDYSSFSGNIDLLAGGVPCQPFSIAGKHLGQDDSRNMFPEMIRAVREIRPKAVLVENVRGLKRRSFLRYFGYIELMLTYPELAPKKGEDWGDHLSRLERYHTKGRPDGLHYRVVHRVLNAADFGVPQKRERVFIVAVRSDLGMEFSFPDSTHSEEALLWSKFCSNEYWTRHHVPKSKRPELSDSLQNRIRGLRESLLTQCLQPWKTVRDALADLPRPAAKRGESEPSLTHFDIKGARSYAGHTGSPLDEPAKTLKAGDHGVPGGENMMVDTEGRVRYFTIRESARLQTFPDQYTFPSSWTESMRQIGNAVPVELAKVVGSKIKSTLERANVQ
jgi:DNA (cytosine-5)-methyltransferase 1